MQVFLPYKSFTESAKVLDYKRLGKQRVETLQLLKALDDPTYGWYNHPAAVMFRGYTDALVAYGLAICDEWHLRGYKDTVFVKIWTYKTVNYTPQQETVPMPPWLGDERFHASHRSNLLRKDSTWYGQFGWSESAGLAYVWPRQPQPPRKSSLDDITSSGTL